jgi:hypothetical protein
VENGLKAPVDIDAAASKVLDKYVINMWRKEIMKGVEELVNRDRLFDQAIASLKEQQKIDSTKKYKINFEGKTIEGTAEKLIECILLLKQETT